MVIEFPIKEKIPQHSNYNVHYNYVLSLLKSAGCKIRLVSASCFDNYSSLCFEIKVDGKLVAIDLSDHKGLNVPDDKIKKYVAIFKFHYIESLHGKYKNIYPFSPVNFQNWQTYATAVSKVAYKAKGLITCKQIARAAALERRNYVQGLLLKTYDKMFDKTIEPEIDFLMKINKTLVSICVPGARNDMLDRGQGQYFALGCCTISPKLVTVLSYNREIIPGTHYVECKPDYSDLIEKIEWVRKNPELAIQIGQNAKKLFNETSLPVKQVEWIKNCIYKI